MYVSLYIYVCSVYVYVCIHVGICIYAIIYLITGDLINKIEVLFKANEEQVMSIENKHEQKINALNFESQKRINLIEKELSHQISVSQQHVLLAQQLRYLYIRV